MTSPAATYERKARSELAAAALSLLNLIGKHVPPEARPAVVDAVHTLVQLTREHERLSILARAYSDDAPEDEAEPDDDDTARLARVRQICDRLEAAYQR